MIEAKARYHDTPIEEAEKFVRKHQYSRVVLTKADLVDENELAAVRDELQIAVGRAGKPRALVLLEETHFPQVLAIEVICIRPRQDECILRRHLGGAR